VYDSAHTNSHLYKLEMFILRSSFAFMASRSTTVACAWALTPSNAMCLGHEGKGGVAWAFLPLPSCPRPPTMPWLWYSV
jgi:hypothetical protein